MTEEEKLRQGIKWLDKRIARIDKERKKTQKKIVELKIDLGGLV